jgi:hypothetical protein
MEKHVMVAGALHIGLSLLILLAAGLVFLILGSVGLLSRDPEALLILGTVGTLVSGFLTILAVPGLIAGIGLLKLTSWSRLLALIVSAFNFLNFPLGTALAVYTIWVLTQDETEQMFARAHP